MGFHGPEREATPLARPEVCPEPAVVCGSKEPHGTGVVFDDEARGNHGYYQLDWREQEELFRWYSNRVDKYLDAGHGVCYLRDPNLADLVAGAIQFFVGQRYELRAWVVMPNHAHVVVWPMPCHTLSDILHSWKSYTAHEINKRLPARVSPFWQTESYEHLIRDDEDLHRCCAYTLLNPVNAGLCAQLEAWKWSSAHVPQASPPASSRTVPVQESGTPVTPPTDTGGETPPELAGGTPAVPEPPTPPPDQRDDKARIGNRGAAI